MTAVRSHLFTLLIAVFLCCQLVYLAGAYVFNLHGPVVTESYRRAERLEVLRARHSHPSPETKAAYAQEVSRLEWHLNIKYATITLMVSLELLAACDVWRYEIVKAA